MKGSTFSRKHVLHPLTQCVSAVSASSLADRCRQYLYRKPCTNNCILKYKQIISATIWCSYKNTAVTSKIESAAAVLHDIPRRHSDLFSQHQRLLFIKYFHFSCQGITKICCERSIRSKLSQEFILYQALQNEIKQVTQLWT